MMDAIDGVEGIDEKPVNVWLFFANGSMQWPQPTS